MTAAAFTLGPRRARRRPGMTAMIDVVFLLLVFFMLAARFGQDMALPLATGGGTGDWQGAPRLIRVLPEATLLNGIATAPEDVAGALTPLLPAPDAPVLIQPADGTDLARLVAVIDMLRAGGIRNLVLVE